MVQYGMDVNIVGTTNWQNLKLWNAKTGWGAVDNFLWIPQEDVVELKAMQIPDSIQYLDGSTRYYDQTKKMSWMCRDRGSLYFAAGEWPTIERIKWGTTAIGGNWVSVDEYQTFNLPHPSDQTRRVTLEMARLKGFRKSDWDRSLPELLSAGLVHRVYCVYKNNQFGDTPRGVCYSPFWSPLDFDFAGNDQPDAFWLPTVWMYP